MAATFLWTFTMCLNELLDAYIDMIPDSNNISVDIYCVPKWTVGYVQWCDPWQQQHFSGKLLCVWMNCWIRLVMIIDGNISVDIYCVPEWIVGYIQWWSLMATIFLWTFAVCLNEHIHTVMIIDGNNISVDIYCVPKWNVGYEQWHDPR